MKYIRVIIIFVILSSLPGLAQTDNGLTSILSPGAALQKISGEFSFTEGPAADASGNIYFTDQPNDRIMVRKVNGELSIFMQPSGRSNGLFIDKKGNIWSCADEKNELWLIKPDKTVEVVLKDFEGKLFNGPNDLWISPDGSVYLTDPFYKRSWWDHTAMPQEKQCVYYLSADRQTLERVADDLVQPNGIIGTPDGKKLYVADIGGKKTWSYTINKDGSLGDKKLFCEMGSDGMTMDAKGNIYLTGKGVTVYDKSGKLVGNIAVPESWTANVCFGDKDRKTLFITASKGFYSIKTRLRGAF